MLTAQSVSQFAPSMLEFSKHPRWRLTTKNTFLNVEIDDTPLQSSPFQFLSRAKTMDDLPISWSEEKHHMNCDISTHVDENDSVDDISEIINTSARSMTPSDVTDSHMTTRDSAQCELIDCNSCQEFLKSQRSVECYEKTTVMLRNIPNKYTQRILINAIDGKGYNKLYDFFYLPIDFRNRCNLGYAFVNFSSQNDAERFMADFDGYQLPAFKSTKICEVCWARVQSLRSNIEHYRNSPVNDMPNSDFKPLLFVDGRPIEFPRPSARDNGSYQRRRFGSPQTHSTNGLPRLQLNGFNGKQNCARKNDPVVTATSTKVFIGGLSIYSTDESIRQHFEKFGDVFEAAVILDKKSGNSRGFGFCSFVSEIPTGLLNMEHWIDGRNVGVRVYTPAMPTSPRQTP